MQYLPSHFKLKIFSCIIIIGVVVVLEVVVMVVVVVVEIFLIFDNFASSFTFMSFTRLTEVKIRLIKYKAIISYLNEFYVRLEIQRY